jgi:hypothetical protein
MSLDVTLYGVDDRDGIGGRGRGRNCFLQLHVQTGTKASVCFPVGLQRILLSVTPTVHLHPVPRLRMYVVLPPLLLYKAWIGMHLKLGHYLFLLHYLQIIIFAFFLQCGVRVCLCAQQLDGFFWWNLTWTLRHWRPPPELILFNFL